MAKRHRIQLELSKDAAQRLETIKQASGACSNAEVFRNALRLYEWLLEQQKKNTKVQVLEEGASHAREVEFVF